MLEAISMIFTGVLDSLSLKITRWIVGLLFAAVLGWGIVSFF